MVADADIMDTAGAVTMDTAGAGDTKRMKKVIEWFLSFLFSLVLDSDSPPYTILEKLLIIVVIGTIIIVILVTAPDTLTGLASMIG